MKDLIAPFKSAVSSAGLWRNRGLRLALILLFTLPQTGCNVAILLGYLIGGPPAIEPDFHKVTKEKMSGKNKTVLVLCYADKHLKWDNDALDYEIAKHLAYQLNAHKIRVIDPDRVQAWLDKNDKWEKASDVGAEFQVDYVIAIDIKDYSLYEERSHDLYRGRADAIVNVHKMEKDKKRGEVIYNKEIAYRFPTRGPVSVYEYSFGNFKKLFLSALSNAIGELFYESYAGDDIPNGMLQ
jgi:hypothetical protein